MQKTNNACMQKLSCDVIKQAIGLTKVLKKKGIAKRGMIKP